MGGCTFSVLALSKGHSLRAVRGREQGAVRGGASQRNGDKVAPPRPGQAAEGPGQAAEGPGRGASGPPVGSLVNGLVTVGVKESKLEGQKSYLRVYYAKVIGRQAIILCKDDPL